MQLSIAVLGTEILDLRFGPDRRDPPPCRFTPAERASFEATAGGDFGFGPLPFLDDRPMPA